MSDNKFSLNDHEKFPWHQAMQFGFGVLHLSPDAFWSMTLVEFNSALQVYFGNSEMPIERDRFNHLLSEYPD